MRLPLPLSIRISLGLLTLGILCAFQLSRSATAQSPNPGGVQFFQEFFGRRGYSDPQVEKNFTLGMMNGLTFTPPVEDGVGRVVGAYGASLMLLFPGAPISTGNTVSSIEQQRSAFDQLAGNSGSQSFWNLMPEWDQSGGDWVPRGRPRYIGLTRQNADARFLQYYENTFPSLSQYLRQPPGSRKYLHAAVTDYSPNVFRAFEMGVELQFLQRGIDELGDLSTGLAFVRGAAKQYGRPWGIDFANWRTSSNSATIYDDTGRLLGGWSDTYFRRNFFAAFAAGARNIHSQAATYSDSSGKLNPFGEVTRAFAEFALRRHPEVAQPFVPAAILIDQQAGFDTKHGAFNQSNTVWYRDIPYSDGDYMLENFFRLAVPNHWLQGLAPNAPFADAKGVPDETKFRAFLSSGGDPRAYEPMPFTRWGDNFDVVTNAISGDALRSYKLILLMGDVRLNPQLRAQLRSWVVEGGVLVMNVAQSSVADEDMLGATIQSNSFRSSSFSRWLPATSPTPEPRYDYRQVVPTLAEVLAVNETMDPLITRRRLGSGEVYLTTPIYMQPKSKQPMLDIDVQLLDALFNRFSIARVTGPPIEFVVGQAPGKTFVTLINNSAGAWVGAVNLHRPSRSFRVMEYISDRPLSFQTLRREVSIPARVPGFGVQVLAVESMGTSAQPGKSEGTER